MTGMENAEKITRASKSNLALAFVSHANGAAT